MKKHNVSEIASSKANWLHNSYIDTEPPLEKALPTGPFKSGTGRSQADLLLFVPRNEIGRTIDALTGRYGYSHLAIDCGEVDVPTGRRVMIESTVAPGVHQAFLEEYGERPYVRIPLENTGMDVEQFCACVHSKVGDHFDNLEVISLGILDNPARQICSDVATVCLPEEMCEKIIRCHEGTVLHPLSVARDELPGSRTRLFVSPNGYAEFFCVPRGSSIHTPDQRVQAQVQEDDQEELLPRIWKLGDAAVTSAWRTVTRH
ncbi:MAG: hypothetical protein ACM3XO_24465 [Bacteroidota bacterium]